MKEIGGYIEFENYNGLEYHSDAIHLNCGRNCLAYLIECYGITKIFLPYFLCDSVFNVCKKYNLDVDFYYIDENFFPIIPDTFESKNWFYLVNYYGQLTVEQIESVKATFTNLIIDNAQDFFRKQFGDIPTIYTCRKFFGVCDGAYLYSKKKITHELERDVSYTRMNYLLGRYEKDASLFYAEASHNNSYFITEPIKKMSKLTENLMKSFDYEMIKLKRTENFLFLDNHLRNINKLKLRKVEGAFAYPLYLQNGVNIRKKLQRKKIYIPTLWPSVLEQCDEGFLEYDYALNILPLPVDQRYTQEDMEYILGVLGNV